MKHPVGIGQLYRLTTTHKFKDKTLSQRRFDTPEAAWTAAALDYANRFWFLGSRPKKRATVARLASNFHIGACWVDVDTREVMAVRFVGLADLNRLPHHL